MSLEVHLFDYWLFSACRNRVSEETSLLAWENVKRCFSFSRLFRYRREQRWRTTNNDFTHLQDVSDRLNLLHHSAGVSVKTGQRKVSLEGGFFWFIRVRKDPGNGEQHSCLREALYVSFLHHVSCYCPNLQMTNISLNLTHVCPGLIETWTKLSKCFEGSASCNVPT